MRYVENGGEINGEQVQFIAAVTNVTQLKDFERLHLEHVEAKATESEVARKAADELRRLQELNIDVSASEDPLLEGNAAADPAQARMR